MEKQPKTIDDLTAIPGAVWKRLRDRGRLDQLETLDFLNPIKHQRLETDNAQQVCDQQRHRFKGMIGELFPAKEVHRFIHGRLAVGNLPMISRYDMNEKFSHVLRTMVLAKTGGNPAEPFDLEADRSGTRSDQGLFSKDEDLFAVRMLKHRPAVSLSILFLRKYLVEFGMLMLRVAKDDIPEHLQKSLEFFFGSWNQNTFIRVLYPAVCVHLYQEIDTSAESVECPEYSQELINATCNWMLLNNAFKGEANPKQHGHASRMSCSAAGFLMDGIRRRGWLKAVFDEVIRQRNDEIMIADLQRIARHADLLGTLIDRSKSA